MRRSFFAAAALLLASAPPSNAMSRFPDFVKTMQRMAPNPSPFATPNPFLFCVWHRDLYPKAANDRMEAPRRGNGADFDGSRPWRMYHGDRVPGFPQHPHRGFETITATLSGYIDHADSMGNAGRYGHGDVQFMTAGKGVVHQEMFPLVHSDRENTLELFQIWLNLPPESKMVEPQFEMHWAEDVRKWRSGDGLAEVTVWVGTYEGVDALPPPAVSWAARPENEVACLLLELRPGGSAPLRPAAGGAAVTRNIYALEGDGAALSGGGESVELQRGRYAELDASAAVELRNEGDGVVRCLVLGGRPIDAPVAQHGPFVMNTRQEIMQAFADYESTRFGGWPYEEEVVVFPRDKGRHAVVDGVEMRPPVDEA